MTEVIHLLLVATIALGVLVIGFVVGMLITAAKETPIPETCTRRAPHICKVNGPCNGWPKDTKEKQ